MDWWMGSGPPKKEKKASFYVWNTSYFQSFVCLWYTLTRMHKLLSIKHSQPTSMMKVRTQQVRLRLTVAVCWREKPAELRAGSLRFLTQELKKHLDGVWNVNKNRLQSLANELLYEERAAQTPFRRQWSSPRSLWSISRHFLFCPCVSKFRTESTTIINTSVSVATFLIFLDHIGTIESLIDSV